MSRPKTPYPTAGELEILKVIWSDGPSTVRQVLDRITRSRKPAYTSVMSLMNVMVDKGLLARKPSGRAFIYSARVREQPTLRKMVADLAHRVFGGSAERLVAHTLDQTEPSSKELDEIQRLIDEYRSSKGKEK
jgi:predicted transcriptional regulator